MTLQPLLRKNLQLESDINYKKLVEDLRAAREKIAHLATQPAVKIEPSEKDNLITSLTLEIKDLTRQHEYQSTAIEDLESSRKRMK